MYKGKRRTEMPPHVFAVADNAYRDMLQGEGVGVRGSGLCEKVGVGVRDGGSGEVCAGITCLHVFSVCLFVRSRGPINPDHVSIISYISCA